MLRTMRNYTKVIMIIVILFFVASCFAGYGLYSRGNRGGGDGMRDYPVAEVNGRKVLRSELEKGAAQISEQYGNNVSSADIPQIRRAALDGIIIQGELQKEIKPDAIHVTENIAIVAAVGRKMAYQPGSSGKIFATLGENGINIRMITQGPEELNIIVGVDGADFEKAIRALYDSFVK